MLRRCPVVFSLLVVFLGLNRASAQLAEAQLKFPIKDSPPAWATVGSDARHSLGEVTQDIQSKIFLVVGLPKSGGVGIGTSWLISKEHRLLATNAHVADFFAEGKTFVIQNGTKTQYPVTNVWYHPGVRRYLGTSTMSIRSIHRKDGHVDPRCPDVAILQLGPGPELPKEVTLAGPEELERLQGKPVAMLGFPGHDNDFNPNQRAGATYHEGVVSRLTDFRMSTDCPENEMQFVQHTIPSFGGFSGSPIYLANGHIIALHNMSRAKDPKDKTAGRIPHGIRLDALWECLVHNNLDSKVPAKFDRAALNVKRWLGPDEREEIFRKVIAMVNEADYLVFTKEDYDRGINLAKQALSVNPEYAPGYRVIAFAYNNVWFSSRRNISHDAGGKLLENASKFMDVYAKLNPTQIDTHLDRVTILNNIGSHYENPKYNREALQICNNVLSMKELSVAHRAQAISSAAIALDNMGDDAQAIRMHLQAVRLQPDAAYLWDRLADFHRYDSGDEALINSCAARSKALREKRYQSGRHWHEYSRVDDKLASNEAFGRVRQGAYYRIHTITLEKDILYQIEMTSPNLDTYLRIEDEQGNPIVDDDDTGGQLDSMIFFSPPETGTYRLVATTFEPRRTGNYTLIVQAGKR